MHGIAVWGLNRGQRLSHRCWDGECVLYNDLSGDTHLLDEFAIELLQLLRSAPQPAAALAVALGVDALPADGECGEGLPEAPDGGVEFATMLADLAALHLIELVPC